MACGVSSYLFQDRLFVLAKLLEHGRTGQAFIETDGDLNLSFRLKRTPSQVDLAAKQVFGKRESATWPSIHRVVHNILSHADHLLEQDSCLLHEKTLEHVIHILSETQAQDVLRLTGISKEALTKKLGSYSTANNELCTYLKKFSFVSENWTFEDFRWSVIKGIDPYDFVQVLADGRVKGISGREAREKLQLVCLLSSGIS